VTERWNEPSGSELNHHSSVPGKAELVLLFIQSAEVTAVVPIVHVLLSFILFMN